MNLVQRIAIGSLLACITLWSQFETGVVLGTVQDTTQSAVGNAKITLRNLDTGIQAGTETDERGNYLFPNVKLGRYRVTVEKAGFTTAFTDNVEVNVNARQRVDVQLTVGQVSESVEVSSGIAAVETDSSERGQVIGQRQIVELP